MLIQSLYKLAPIQGKKSKVREKRSCQFEGCEEWWYLMNNGARKYCVEHQYEMRLIHDRKQARKKRNT